MLNLEMLKKHNTDILKAETVALFFNMGKTHAGIGNWRKKYFPNEKELFSNGYRGYFGIKKNKNTKEIEIDLENSTFIKELRNVSSDLEEFFLKHKVILPYKELKDGKIVPIDTTKVENNKENNKKIKLIDIIVDEKDEKLCKKFFLRGCENINSGIDKGTPDEDKKIKDILYIANAFGTLKNEINDNKNFDGRRKLFWQSLHSFLDKNNYYKDDYYKTEPDRKAIKEYWKEIRKWVFEEMEPWYSSLLSDNRMPINDITLWDQVYMVATMFKAVLADMYLIASSPSKKEKFIDYFENPASIKWRILGIQYDKLALAERGFRPSHIEWYRETARRIDKEVKNLIEIKYALGNEIYRDETGIYFLVGENLASNDKAPLSTLHPDLSNIKNEILQIFKEECQDEFYPAILLTKPSRGLMNLTYLLQKTKENFLQPDYSQKSFHFEGMGKSTICPVCRIRAFSVSDKKGSREEDKFICDECQKNKGTKRLENWLKNIDGETIWTSQLQDKNGRIALVTLKFELMEWLSGNMLNSLLIRETDYDEKLKEIEMFFRTFLSNEPLFPGSFDETPGSYKWINKLEDEIINLLKNKKLSNNRESIVQIKSCLSQIEKMLIKGHTIPQLVNEIRKKFFSNSIKLNERLCLGKYQNNTIEDIINFVYKGNDSLQNLSEKLKNLINQIQNYKDHFNEEEYRKFISEIDKLLKRIKELQKGSFFFPDLAKESYGGCVGNGETFSDWIRQVFFGSITGNEWEDFVRNSALNEFIDWDSQTMHWDKWNKDAITLFSQLLLQFLIRKNPSPARLRRVWETTENFFKDIDLKELAGIKDEDCTRLYWPNQNKENKECQNIKDGEYQDGELLFWVKNGNVYLITSLSKIPKNKDTFVLKPYGQKGSKEEPSFKLSMDEAKKGRFKPYFSIIDPTPVSWQFVIPAEYVPNLINGIIDRYRQNFKWVYGKLSLHIGIVVQHYKKPLYLGIKALRRIRRDNVETSDIQKITKAKNITPIHAKIINIEEEKNDTGKYYSLYEVVNTDNETANAKEHYNFYLAPKSDRLKRIKPLTDFKNNEEIIYYPNTLDFEFLDTNTRRNEIFYTKGKRKLPLKKNRPYTLEEAKKILELGRNLNENLNDNNNKNNKDNNKDNKYEETASQIHNFITQLYSKYEDWDIENDDTNIQSFKLYLTSLLVNTFKLNKKENRELKKAFAEILGISDISELQNKSNDEIRWIVRLFFDSFEFWHKALKEVLKNEKFS